VGQFSVSNFWKFTFIMGVACASALISAQTVVLMAKQAPVFRAASVQAAISAANSAAVQGAPQPDAQQQATIRKGPDGHYWAVGDVNGAKVRFLVDTGATAVALTAGDAQRIGFDVASLEYTSRVLTAAGPVRAAKVELDSVSVGGARVSHVVALVPERGLEVSLLGMTYLGRLASFQATPRALILQP
jgi:aspartyl protease family protein